MPATFFYHYSETGIRKLIISCDGLNEELILQFYGGSGEVYAKFETESIPFNSIIDLKVGNKDPVFNQYRNNIKARRAEEYALFLSLRTQKKTYGFECSHHYDFDYIRAFIGQVIKMNVLKAKSQLLDQQVQLLNETILKLKQSQSSEKPVEPPQEEPLPDDIYNAMYG